MSGGQATGAPEDRPAQAGGITAPFRYTIFRRIWTASLLSNFGMLINGVGAAWAMTELTGRADKVALVQTAAMLPTMFVALAAGAIADMYDRRAIGLSALSLCFTAALSLSAVSFAGLLSPNLILLFCFIIGGGMALYQPSWQASVSEQVPSESLPAAVALNSISFNIARSFGPALGGVIVAAAGPVAAFVTNALFYLPLMAVLFLWKRERSQARLPPERIGRAIISGVRYVIHSPPLRLMLVRTFCLGAAGASVLALMPLVAKDLLGGGAPLYGIILGAFGVGAVFGALQVGRLRERYSSETLMRCCCVLLGLALIGVALSPWAVLTGAVLIGAGVGWMIAITVFNISIQLSAPRWVAGRALAGFQASIAGGVAAGSFAWGSFAEAYGIGATMLFSGVAVILCGLMGFWLPMPAVDGSSTEPRNELADPNVALALTGRSGPIVIEIEYQVDPAEARHFYDVMQRLQLVRHRNGAYGWSLSRDIAAPERWTERYHCPTWHDYLRQRQRMTEQEHMLQREAAAFQLDPDAFRIRRLLERPFGSVRWKEETPDPRTAHVPHTTPGGV